MLTYSLLSLPYFNSTSSSSTSVCSNSCFFRFVTNLSWHCLYFVSFFFLSLIENRYCCYSRVLCSGQYFILYEVAVCATSGPFHRRAPSWKDVTPLKHTLCCWTGATKIKKKRVCVKPNTQIGIDRKKWTSEYNILSIKRRKRKETKNEEALLCYIKWFLSVFNKLSLFSPRADDFLSGSKDEKNSFIVLDFCRFRAGQPGYVLNFFAIFSFFISILKLYRYFPFFFTIYLSFPLFPPFFSFFFF